MSWPVHTTESGAGLASAWGVPMPLAADWSWWRLPPNYSVHGGQIDTLYYTILWLTLFVLVGVWAVMAWFLIKYRHRPDRKKGVFSHGNTKLEMVWTLIPAVILIVLSLWTKYSWDNYRYSPTANNKDLARILVVGQQFKWYAVYPGPDGKLGRYLVYPKTTDLRWPVQDPNQKPEDAFPFPGQGPAFLPAAEARKVINAYIDKFPLGNDFSDPNGKDDDWKDALGRPVYVPKGRPVEINLTSKDVLHDFFLPNFRVKLDAVPGMRGLIYFTPTQSSAEFEAKSRREFTLDELAKTIGAKGSPDYKIVILPGDPLADDDNGLRYSKEVEERVRNRTVKKRVTVARDNEFVTPKLIGELREFGVTKMTAYSPKVWDLVCEELCGAGHATMKGDLIVLEPDEYRKRFETPAAAAPAAAEVPAPATPVAAAKPE